MEVSGYSKPGEGNGDRDVVREKTKEPVMQGLVGLWLLTCVKRELLEDSK